MKKIFMAVVIAGMLAVFSGNVFAGSVNAPGIRERIEEQQRRIDDGIASGELTRAEAARVQLKLDKIKARESRLSADGKLTPRERKRLHRMLDANNKKIFHKKHNPRKMD